MKNRDLLVCCAAFLLIGVMKPAIDTPSVMAAMAPPLSRDFVLPSQLFTSDSAWNQSAVLAAVLPTSNQQITVTYRVLRGDATTLSPGSYAPDWPYPAVNYDDYTIPIFRTGPTQSSVVIRDYAGNLQWPSPKFQVGTLGGPVTLPVPAATVRPSGPASTNADGHLVLYDIATFTEYDFWDATTALNGDTSLGGGQLGNVILRSGAIDFFDVRGSGSNLPTYCSARATGTPLLAGLILPEDVERGVIAHALAFAIPGLRNTSADPSTPLSSDYFYPTTTTETGNYNTNANALAAGQRIRLKPTLINADGNPIPDETQLAPITRMFLTALRTYGAYAVDNAGGFAFYAEDMHSAVLHLTDDQINALIGQLPGTPLATTKTKWQIVMERLNQDLEQIPIAYGPWAAGQNPATATVTVSNFDVVEPAALPIPATCKIYLPLVLKNYSPPESLSLVNDFL